MMEFASSIYVMDSGNAQTVRDVASRFGLDDPEEQAAIATRIHGPRKGGGTFFVQYHTNQGKYSMLLSNTLGPIELWAFSTTAEDVSIRNKVYEKAGPKLGRQALAHLFPGGSAKGEVEDRRERLKERTGTLDEKADANVLGEIANEVIALAERIRMRIGE